MSRKKIAYDLNIIAAKVKIILIPAALGAGTIFQYKRALGWKSN